MGAAALHLDNEDLIARLGAERDALLAELDLALTERELWRGRAVALLAGWTPRPHPDKHGVWIWEHEAGGYDEAWATDIPARVRASVGLG